MCGVKVCVWCEGVWCEDVCGVKVSVWCEVKVCVWCEGVCVV